MGLVLPLRQRVLRPHQRLAEVITDGDSTGIHFAAFGDDVIVGVASLQSEPAGPASEPCWRLRGMAIDPTMQARGVGRAVMSELLDFVARSGGGQIWCAARMAAVGFYERFGFDVIGDVFEEPVIGPHIRMERHVERHRDEGVR
jgi:GNAT superfamily N-acetyltransferase